MIRKRWHEWLIRGYISEVYMTTIFKFKPLLALEEEQIKFHSEMSHLDKYKYIEGRVWSCVSEGERIETMAHDVACKFPNIVFVGFGQYRFGNTVAGTFRFIFNSNDIRLFVIYDDNDDFIVDSAENYFPHDVPEDKCGVDPTWIVREWNEEDGFNECSERFNNYNSSYSF